MLRDVRLRFFVVALAVFTLDAALALSLAAAGLPLLLAAGVGFAVGALAAYPAHEYWTFARPSSGRSARRLAQSLVAAGAALSARVATVAALEALHPAQGWLAATYLLAGAGLSLCVNFLISRAWVFRR